MRRGGGDKGKCCSAQGRPKMSGEHHVEPLFPCSTVSITPRGSVVAWIEVESNRLPAVEFLLRERPRLAAWIHDRTVRRVGRRAKGRIVVVAPGVAHFGGSRRAILIHLHHQGDN